jgi:hypothetical protein
MKLLEPIVTFLAEAAPVIARRCKGVCLNSRSHHPWIGSSIYFLNVPGVHQQILLNLGIVVTIVVLFPLYTAARNANTRARASPVARKRHSFLSNPHFLMTLAFLGSTCGDSTIVHSWDQSSISSPISNTGDDEATLVQVAGGTRRLAGSDRMHAYMPRFNYI